uniref:KAT8 regulatory NSL complex subunit 2 n=1 Tax=Anopheles melas TaxID=34690 RepID=A0A182TX24_9DIPT
MVTLCEPSDVASVIEPSELVVIPTLIVCPLASRAVPAISSVKIDVDVTTVNDAGRIILDYASDSSDEDEALVNPTYGSTWKAHEMDNSDNESVDSQSDDPLKHAGIYTAEEATRITKEKLTRLQTLYIEQIHRLQHVLRERRRNYLREQRAERDYHCSIFDQVKQTPRERMLYEQLKGLNRYHRKHGVEAILQRKYLEKRAKATEGLQQKPPSLPKCAYTEGGVKCGERTLPCCKHCRKHILEDKKQVLFRACGIEKSGVVCQEPLAGLFENVTCPLHMELPAQRSFNKRKYESESEGEGEVSGMEPPVVVVAGVEKSSAKAANETNAATAQAGAPEDKKAVKMEPKAGGDGTVDAKAPVKAENNKRKVIKTEPVTPVPRVRNTRSSRAAMAMQEDAPAEQPAPEQQAAEGELKKEQTEAKENENNVTSAAATATVDQTDEVAVDLEESLLPVSIIPNRKQKSDEATVAEQVSEMGRMNTSTEAAESANEAMETETTDERQAEPSTVPDQPKEGAEGDKKEEEKTAETEEATEESSVAAEKEETNTTTTITATENSQPKGADDTTTTASVEESASPAPKESDDRTDQTPKAQAKPQPSPLTARQRKLRLATDRKESAVKGTNETATATATDEVGGTSDEEKAKKAKGGKAEPSSGSSAAGGSGSEQKSRRQK